MRLKKFFILLVIIFQYIPGIFAQVTTGSITGLVTNNRKELLAGSTIKITHMPTGTEYYTTTGKAGTFNIPNIIPGGPYAAEISHAGYNNFSENNINIELGENIRLEIILPEKLVTLSEITVSTYPKNSKKTGASTAIGRKLIASLPTINRTVQDFTRINPQANGTSFGGISSKFNNITIDGSVTNDVFGLSPAGTPGGQASTTPISLDAIQEIQVVLAPYDVSYGNFTGAGINAVTRSGTNKYEGSAYYFFRNENLTGKEPVTRVKSTPFNDNQYGFRIGGPVIKSKLFFFLSAEQQRRGNPTLYNPGDTGALVSTAGAFSIDSFVRARYNYDPGTIDPVMLKTYSDKLFGRLDWNINSHNSLTLRHNYVNAFSDNMSRSNTIFRFANNAYRSNNKQNITVAELRSKISRIVSNNLLLSKQALRDFRTTGGSLFPQVEITSGPGIVYLGSERSSVANSLDQDIFELTDNLKIFSGKNTFTVGTHNEFFKFNSISIPNINGRWRFNSLEDFYNNIPKNFDVTYAADKTADPRPAAKFKASQLGFYLQDELQANSLLRITIGLRADLPLMHSRPANNPAVDSTFNGKYNTSYIPANRLLWSPRFGFNYDPEGDKSIILRGGIGVFTGRVPFVWISNQFANTGLLLKSTSQTGAAVNGGNGFDPAVDPSSIGTGIPTYEVNVIDKKFRMPQVWKLDVAADRKLPGDINLTAEIIFSQVLHNINYQNVNLTEPTGFVDTSYNHGYDKRVAFGSTTATRNINPLFTRVMLLSNTSKGYAFNAGFTINKEWKHFFAQLAYNYNSTTEVNGGTGTNAVSSWESVPVVGNSNQQPLTISSYEQKHRITAILSADFNFLKHLRTSVALFYDGHSGKPFSYIVNGDLNSDNQFANDLVYIPNNAAEINFIDVKNSQGQVTLTAAQQYADFEAYISKDKYLLKRRGKYTERNGSNTPFENVIDARVSQDISINIVKRKHNLQLSCDILNLSNLLNIGWGRRYQVNMGAYSLLTTTAGTGGVKGYNFIGAKTPWNIDSTSRWQVQLGVRYTFD